MHARAADHGPRIGIKGLREGIHGYPEPARQRLN
jgi:hypothetical protein